MKILSLLGSPKKNGNTAVLLDKVIEGILSKNDADHEIIYLQDCDIKPCRGCKVCKRDRLSVCAIDDDMQEIYKKLDEADLIIMATPIYWWSVSAQLKLLIDRLYGMHFGEPGTNYENKRVVMLMTYGSELPNSGPETVRNLFGEVCGYIRVKSGGVFGVCTEKLEVKDNPEALKNAFEFGMSI